LPFFFLFAILPHQASRPVFAPGKAFFLQSPGYRRPFHRKSRLPLELLCPLLFPFCRQFVTEIFKKAVKFKINKDFWQEYGNFYGNVYIKLLLPASSLQARAKTVKKLL